MILGSSSGQVGPYDAGVGAGSYGGGSGGYPADGAGSYGGGVGVADAYGGGSGFSTHEASHFSLDSNRLSFPLHPL